MTENSFKFDLPTHHKSIIKVIGVGGGGSNAVNYMYNQGITGVEFIVCNTDAQALNTSTVSNKLQIGVDLTEGLGAGANPEKGKNAALENKEDIRNMLSENTKMLFVTAGMGGGTGTGATPVIAQVAKELGILTVGIVTIPFKFEGKKKMRQAMKGVESLKANADTVLLILNDKLTETFGKLKLNEAFSKADNVLTTAAKGIAEIITVPGHINVDFEDVKTVMKDSGAAVMGSSEMSGENRALRAAEEAINSPLLNNQNIKGANKILLSIISGDQDELQMEELTEITDFMQDLAGEEAEVIFGHGVDNELGDKIRVTVIATGFEGKGNAPKNIDYTPTQSTPSPVEILPKHDLGEEQVRKVYDLNKDCQADLFADQNERRKQETLDEEFQIKMKSFSFGKPSQSIDKDKQQSAKVAGFDMEKQKKVAEAKDIKLDNDQSLDELDIAQSPSKKMLLMEQSKDRRKKLEGISPNESIDTSSYNEKFNIPAYQRKKISFRELPSSSENLAAKYNLNDDPELGENRFLHDRPD